MTLKIKRVCVFCGSSKGTRPAYEEAAVQFGAALTAHGFELVYGGGCVGLMGLLADAVLERGGRVIGVIPEHLVAKELAHKGLTELRVVASMHERKAMMEELADAFVALPGGYGTFEEFCEIITWAQLGLHQKPCGLLNVDHFYDPLIAQIDHAVTEGFIQPGYRGLVLDEINPDRLLQRLLDYNAPAITKWMDRGEG